MRVLVLALLVSCTPSPVSQRRPYVAIPGKGVRCLWGQFGMRASPNTSPNIDTVLQTLNNPIGRSQDCMMMEVLELMAVLNVWQNNSIIHVTTCQMALSCWNHADCNLYLVQLSPTLQH